MISARYSDRPAVGASLHFGRAVRRIGLALGVSAVVAAPLPSVAADDTVPVETGAAERAAAPLPEVDEDDLPMPKFEAPVVRPLSAADLPPPNVFAFGRRYRDRPPQMPRISASLLARGDRAGYRAVVEREARAFDVPPELADAVMAAESSYDPTTVGADGEVGLMQLMPATARMLGFAGTLDELAIPEINIHYGVRYLAGAWRLGGRDICTAAMKYRAGHGETRFSVRSVEYCLKVRAHLAARGFPVVGAVPEPTFGQSGSTGAVRGRYPVRDSVRIDFADLNARILALSARITYRPVR